MDDAQTVFKAWTKDALAPALRGMGFRGSGQVFTLPDEECWALLGIQKSTSSTSELLKFTLNFSVANRHLWNELREWKHYWLGARPSANIQSPSRTMLRIGNVLPDGNDKWWSVAADASPAELATLLSEVETAVRDYGLPELRSMIEANSLDRVDDSLNAINRTRRRPAHLK